MADDVHEIVEGDGWAVAHIDALGEPYGFRKIRKSLNVTEFGINAVVMPAGFASGRHFHDEQQELYFVHEGRLQFEFGDGSTHVLGPGGVARVDASTVRRIRNVGDGDAIYVATGGKGGYAGRDGRAPDPSEPRFEGPPGAAPPQ